MKRIFTSLAALGLLVCSCPLAPGASPAYDGADDLNIPDKLPPPQTKSMEDWYAALAFTAASWGAPLVTMYNLRQNDALGAHPLAAPNAIWRMADISTPQLSQEAGYVTPNVNTVYGFGFLDLGPEPVILTVPDSHGRFYLVQLVDMWTNAFAYPAGSELGYSGGKFAITAPGWKGHLPKDVKQIKAPTRWILIQPRVHLASQADLPGARKVLEGIQVQGLAAYLGHEAPAAPKYAYAVPDLIDPTLPVSALDFKDPLQFWDLLSEALNENPPPQDQIDALLPIFRPLGLEIGKKWDRTTLHPLILQQMARAVQGIGPILDELPTGTVINGWAISPPSIGDFGTHYKTRAVIARVGLTANTPKEAVYFIAQLSDAYQPLTGAHQYTLTFQKTPPFVPPGFWSVTMYDGKNNYTVPNALNRYSLGSDNKMVPNADGSLTLYIQADNPGKEHEANWLPAPAAPFYLTLRAYAPGDAMIKTLSDHKSFLPPPVRLVPQAVPKS